MSILDTVREQRTAIDAKLDALIAAAETESRDMTGDEFAEFKSLNEQVAELKSREDEIVAHEARKADQAAAAKAHTPEEKRTAVVSVRADEPTYHPNGKHSFFADALAAQRGLGSGEIGERLNRFQNEVRSAPEYRDVSSANLGNGLVVPQYLPDMYAENLRAGRVTANLCNAQPLPDSGMTITIPRGTTKTTVAAQTADNQSVSETDFDSTDLTFNVNTYAGLNDVSRQSIERGYNLDSIIYGDLAADYSKQLDSDVINGAGTSGAHTGILNTSNILSVTTGTATAASVLAKIGKALSDVNGNRFMPADVIIMHPRRWGWLTVQSDSNGRPYVLPQGNGPMNAFGVGEPAAYGFVGSVFGVPVYTDANIPTTISTSTITGSTEDNIIVARKEDLLLFEDSVAPRTFRFEDVGSGTLTIRLLVAGYSAFTAGWYPKGVAVVSGSGMTTPTFP